MAWKRRVVFLSVSKELMQTDDPFRPEDRRHMEPCWQPSRLDLKGTLGNAPVPPPLAYVDSEKVHLLLLGSGQTHDPTAHRHTLDAFSSSYG